MAGCAVKRAETICAAWASDRDTESLTIVVLCMGTHTQMLEARADSIQKYTKVYECVRMHTKVYECIRIKRKLQLLDLMQLYFERLWAPTVLGPGTCVRVGREGPLHRQTHLGEPLRASGREWDNVLAPADVAVRWPLQTGSLAGFWDPVGGHSSLSLVFV